MNLIKKSNPNPKYRHNGINVGRKYLVYPTQLEIIKK